MTATRGVAWMDNCGCVGRQEEPGGEAVWLRCEQHRGKRSRLQRAIDRIEQLEYQVSILRGVPADKLFGACPGCLERPCTHKTPACPRRSYCPSCKHEPCNYSGASCPREGLR